jgi:hypothetical protein
MSAVEVPAPPPLATMFPVVAPEDVANKTEFPPLDPEPVPPVFV